MEMNVSDDEEVILKLLRALDLDVNEVIRAISAVSRAKAAGEPPTNEGGYLKPIMVRDRTEHEAALLTQRRRQVFRRPRSADTRPIP